MINIKIIEIHEMLWLSNQPKILHEIINEDMLESMKDQDMYLSLILDRYFEVMTNEYSLMNNYLTELDKKNLEMVYKFIKYYNSRSAQDLYKMIYLIIE